MGQREMAIDAAGNEYPRTKLATPIATKDRGTLHTIQDAWDYLAAIGKERATPVGIGFLRSPSVCAF